MAAAPFLSVWLVLFAEVNQRLVVVPERLKPSPAFDVGEPAEMERVTDERTNNVRGC